MVGAPDVPPEFRTAPLASNTEPVELHADLEAPCSPDELFSWVDDLDRYPQWLGIVRRAEALDSSGDATVPAWNIDLSAQLGPLSRSKRLRMVRTQHTVEPARTVVFERQELDGRTHGSWVLRAAVQPNGDGSNLEMTLHYDGRLWGPALRTLLDQEIERSRARLIDLVTVR